MTDLPHFHQRCAERGITACPSVLRDDLRRAVKMARLGDPVASDYVERVPSPGEQSEIYRFRVADGIFYAVVAQNGNPMTILTQSMYRGKRFAAKMTRRNIAKRLAPRD